MLQWMGGSRRKVTTSRKSTHKRQKQYFEQRRQLQQQTAGLEDQDDRKHMGNQYCENNRSLDILSLINVSTVGEEHAASCLSDNLEDDDFSWDNQNSQSPVMDNNEDIPVDQSEGNEKIVISGTSPSYHHTTKYLKKVPIHLPEHAEDFVEHGNKPRDFKLSTMPHMSVVDLLGDDGPNSSVEETSAHVPEAHVAFSVEGLGKGETETPVQSPKMLVRCPVKGFSSPRKASRRSITLEQLDYSAEELNSPVAIMMHDLFPQNGRSMGRFFSREPVDSNLNPKFFNSRNPSPFNWDGNSLKDVSSNDEIFDNIQCRGRNIWDVGPSFLDDNIDDLGGRRLFCEKRTGKKNDVYENYFDNDCWMPDISFENWNLMNDRSSIRRKDHFDVTDSPVSYLESLAPKDFTDCNAPNMRYYTIGTDSDIKYKVKNFIGEDPAESFSLLSEESCSSTAVRGDLE